MNLKIYYCKDGDLSQDYLKAEFKHRTLSFQNGDIVEVECDFYPELNVHFEGKVNVLFLDRDNSVDIYDRKFFAKIKWSEKHKLKWAYNKYWILQKDFQIKMIYSIVSFGLGMLTEYLRSH